MILPTFSNCKHIQLGYWWQFFCQKIVCFFQPHILFVFRSLLGWIIIIEIFFEVGLGRFHNKGVDHTKLWSKGIVTRSAVARTRPEKDPPLLMRIYLCLFVLFQMFCIVIPCTSPLSYVVGVKHIVIEALPDLCVCRTLCKYMIPDTFRASLMPS